MNKEKIEEEVKKIENISGCLKADLWTILNDDEEFGNKAMRITLSNLTEATDRLRRELIGGGHREENS